MRKLFLIAGHGGKDSGAVSGSYIERDLAIELRFLINNELRRLNVIPTMDANENYLALTLSWLRGKLNEKDVIIDIHWNASSNPSASGTEIIIPNVSSEYEKSFAAVLASTIASIGFKNRGVKPESDTARKKLAIMRPAAENILIEVCFISNTQDMLLYQKSKQILAKKLAYIIKDYLNK